MYSVLIEYKINKEFKSYVERYCKDNATTPENALTHLLVYLVGKSCYEKRKESE